LAENNVLRPNITCRMSSFIPASEEEKNSESESVVDRRAMT
jgi:hypothetical protein